MNVSDSEPMNSLLEENFTLPNTTTLLEQLHTIDNAACGWTNFMSKVWGRIWFNLSNFISITKKLCCLFCSWIRINMNTTISLFYLIALFILIEKLYNSDFFSTLFFILKTKSVLNASGQCGYLQRLLWWREHCQLHTEPGLPGQCLRLCKWVITFISFIVMRIWGNKIVLRIISKCNVGLIFSVNDNFFIWFCSVMWLSYFLTRFETLTHPFPIKITFAWFI